MRKEGSEPDLREQLDGCIWQLLAAEEWETAGKMGSLDFRGDSKTWGGGSQTLALSWQR